MWLSVLLFETQIDPAPIILRNVFRNLGQGQMRPKFCEIWDHMIICSRNKMHAKLSQNLAKNNW